MPVDTRQAAKKGQKATAKKRRKSDQGTDSGKQPPAKKQRDAKTAGSSRARARCAKTEVIDLDGDDEAADDAGNASAGLPSDDPVDSPDEDDDVFVRDEEGGLEDGTTSGDGGAPGTGSDESHDEGDGEISELEVPEKTYLKIEKTADLLTVFTEPVKARFKSADGSSVEKTGRWCTICRDDTKIQAKRGKRAGWYTGANSTCRRHIASFHYKTYHERCKEKGLNESKEAIPKSVLKAREDAAKEKKVARQATLDTVVQKVETPTSFSPTSILHEVTVHVVVNDQALLVASTPTFTNCLVAMRPKTTRKELPTRTTVRSNIKNKYNDYVHTIRDDIRAAPGDVSPNWDLWTEDHAGLAYFGMTGQWIDVQGDDWHLRAEVLALHNISGDHSGKNLGRYFIKLTDRVGITSRTEPSKLGYITADNTTNNDTTAREVELQLRKRGTTDWYAGERKLGCMGHIVQLGIEDFMGEVTKIAVIESKQAIWEYDPTLPENTVTCGGLDVVSILRTVTIKIQASPQRKEAFERYQKNCGFDPPLVIPLHGNTRWGSAHKMCERSYNLREAIDAFILSADARFGPITTIRKDGKIVKKIPWSAFRLQEDDWERVALCVDILADANRYQQHFSSDTIPTIHRVIPALESLCTRWEKKLDNVKYELFHGAIRCGLEKLSKYYTKLDQTDVYIKALLLHPYYKLSYIEDKWGGAEEQAEEIANGNPNAVDWKAYARKVAEDAMREYWPKRLNRDTDIPNTAAADDAGANDSGSASGSDVDSFDRGRRQRLLAEQNDGWLAELDRYLADPALKVKKDTDTVHWWSKHTDQYPTLARMALDILPVPASSVAVERLFSRSKEVSTARRSRLGPDLFEWIECLHYHWARQVVDYARINSDIVEEYIEDEFVEFYELEELLADDESSD